MRAIQSSIVGKNARHPMATAAVEDFECNKQGEVDAMIVLRDPNVSLYCVDHCRRSAIFVRTVGMDQNDVPFLYQAQYESAREVISVPYEYLIEMADRQRFEANQVTLIYSMGRCGSTLAVRALSKARRMCALSEPDVFTQLVYLGSEFGFSREMRLLCRACIRIICAALLRNDHRRSCALKFRGSVVGLWDILESELSGCNVIYMYREAGCWAESVVRSSELCNVEALRYAMELQGLILSLVPIGEEAEFGANGLLAAEDLLARFWVYSMRCFEDKRDRGAPVFAIKFEDLVRSPELVIKAMYKYCNLDIIDSAYIESVIRDDSQEGTRLSRSAVAHHLSASGNVDKNKVRALVCKFLES